MSRGSVFAEEAYALGKVLDHSDWQRGELRLPRNITPSDIDAAFDNDGAIIFAEFSSSHAEWRDLEKGQRKTYQSAIRGTNHVAVLCRHSVKPELGRKINSRTDVESFQAILFAAGRFVTCKTITGNARWQRFVDSWFTSPEVTRDLLLDYGMKEAA